MQKLKDPKFIGALIVTILGILLANGVLGTTGALPTVAGYVMQVAALLGIHLLSPIDPTKTEVA